MSISAPYRFVPLSKAIVTPDWAAQASHDVPFEDGISGELLIGLTAHTALCIGGRQDKATDRSPGKVHFYRDPDGNPAIPGSSLKGMLRSVLEIAGFGCFNAVQDKTLGVRDITKKENFYSKAMGDRTQAGWLRFENGIWSIHPCAYVRVLQSELIEECRIAPDEWKKLAKAKERYAKLGVFRQVKFDEVSGSDIKAKPLAKLNSNGAMSGYVVVTGQPGHDYTKPNAKKKEFIFRDETAPAMTVPDEVMSGFRQIYEDTEEWRFWMDKLGSGGLKPGIPVFFNQEQGQVRSLGLTLMYKLPYKLGLHQAIANTHPSHLDSLRPDLARLIFGHIDEIGNDSLRGRVAISQASAIDPDSMEMKWSGPTVLNGPKVNYYPTYIRQHDRKGNEWNQLMKADAELAGWKRYPLKAVDIQAPPDGAGTKVQVEMETAPAGSRFACKVRFHNLRFVELGALLWVMTLPSADAKSVHRHNIGMGKPYGLGQISLEVQEYDFRLNNPRLADGIDASDLQAACIGEFNRYMDSALGQSWLECAPMRALLDYMTQGNLSAESLRYMELKSFSDNKRDMENAAGFHQPGGVGEVHPNRFTPDLVGSLDAARTRQADRLAKAEREARKSNASDEQRLLLELEELLARDPGKTVLGNIEGALASAWNTLVQFEGDDRSKLMELTARADALGKKPISKICKKILGSAAG